MWKRFGPRRDGLDLELELRQNRPEPPADFLRLLTDDVRGRHPAGPGSLRLTVALAGTLGLLLSLASVGGLGYAASGPKEAAKAVERLVTPESNKPVRTVKQSPASHQYRVKCNSGRGNLSETENGTRQTDSETLKNPHTGARGPGKFPTDDCDPGNSGPQNRGGD
jgi:hypothetical protein